MRNTKLYLLGLTMAITFAAAGCGKMDPSLETIDLSQTSVAQGTTAPQATKAETTTAESAQTTEAETEAPTTTEEQTEPEITVAPETTEAIPESFSECAQIVQATTNVNLRMGPGTNYDSAGILAEGTKVSRVGIGQDWSMIIYNGNSYYVASQYLNLIADGETLDVTATTSAEESVSDVILPTSEGSSILDFRGWSLADISGISNKDIPFGYSSESRDEFNRPTGCVSYYTNLYGKYGANFIAPNTNQIYLTMDEGYEAGYTPIILDTLKAKGVKAVFFVTKQFVTENPDLVTRMINEGHQIGNHTCAHPSGGMPQLGIEAEYNDITWLQNYVAENWGYNMTLFRYPEGMFSEQSLALVNSLGLTPVFWSFAHADWNVNNQPDVSASLQRVLNECHPGAIYLLHAVSATNTTILADFIDGARAKGFEFGVYPSTGF